MDPACWRRGASGGVSASGGSACASGSNVGSHVLSALNISPNRGAVRFSFSKFNKPEEIDLICKLVLEIQRKK